MISETFGSLLRDRAHWEFEIFLMLIFDGVIAGLIFPFALKHWKHHIARDSRDKTYGYFDASSTPFEVPDRWAHLSTPDMLAEDVHDWSLTHPDHVAALPDDCSHQLNGKKTLVSIEEVGAKSLCVRCMIWSCNYCNFKGSALEVTTHLLQVHENPRKPLTTP